MQEIFLFHDINASFNRDKYISAYLSFLSNSFALKYKFANIVGRI